MEVVSARDIIPEAFQDVGNGANRTGGDDADDDYDDEVVAKEDVVDDLEYDVFNLMASNYHEIRFAAGEEKETVLKSITQRATQLLVKRLLACPTETSDVGPLIVLPDEVTKMPRATKIPEAKPLTKWEKFAKEKGIKKQKKERMVYDETNQEFRPRYGYKRANAGIADTPVVEVKPGQDPFADPWAEARAEKKDRVKKNLKQQKRNQGLALRAQGKTLPVNSYDPATVPGIPVNMTGGKTGAAATSGIGIGAEKGSKNQRGKSGLRSALQLVQHSTASMGRYDEMRPGEPMRKITGKKRAFRDNLGNSSAEKESMKAQLRFVADKADKKAKGVTNSLAAYEGIIPDKPTDSFRQKKGKVRVRNDSAGAAGVDSRPKKSAGKRKGK